jgi:hypothetical protein
MQLFNTLRKDQKAVGDVEWWTYTCWYIVGPWALSFVMMLVPTKGIRERVLGLVTIVGMFIPLYLVWIDFQYCLPLSMHDMAYSVMAIAAVLFVFTFAFYPVTAHLCLLTVLCGYAGTSGKLMDEIQWFAWMTVLGPIVMDAVNPIKIRNEL